MVGLISMSTQGTDEYVFSEEHWLQFCSPSENEKACLTLYPEVKFIPNNICKLNLYFFSPPVHLSTLPKQSELYPQEQQSYIMACLNFNLNCPPSHVSYNDFTASVHHRRHQTVPSFWMLWITTVQEVIDIIFRYIWSMCSVIATALYPFSTAFIFSVLSNQRKRYIIKQKFTSRRWSVPFRVLIVDCFIQIEYVLPAYHHVWSRQWQHWISWISFKMLSDHWYRSPAVQMNGGIFMIVARISCSPSQKETKKLPVMWVPASYDYIPYLQKGQSKFGFMLGFRTLCMMMAWWLQNSLLKGTSANFCLLSRIKNIYNIRNIYIYILSERDCRHHAWLIKLLKAMCMCVGKAWKFWSI